MTSSGRKSPLRAGDIAPVADCAERARVTNDFERGYGDHFDPNEVPLELGHLMMNRTCFSGLVLVFAAATNLFAQREPRKDEYVHWAPHRNVKDAIHAEIARFEKEVVVPDAGKMPVAADMWRGEERHVRVGSTLAKEAQEWFTDIKPNRQLNLLIKRLQ